VPEQSLPFIKACFSATRGPLVTAKSTINVNLPTVTADMRCGQVFELMRIWEGGSALAVLDDGQGPVGLIARHTLLQAFAHPVTYALYENRPVRLLMNQDPMVVDAEETIDRVSEQIATDYPDAVDEGFIVTENGRYLGMGTVLQVLDSSVQHARKQIADLENARAAAEHANLAKSAFLANMSHELRTPLNAVLGFADLLASGTAGEVTDQQAEYLGDIQTSGRRLLDLINDLLDLSRAESGRLELLEERTDPAGLIEEVRRMLAPRATAAGISIEMEITTEADVWGDERKLAQVLMNLATNAVKFTPAGGSVTLGLDQGRDGAVTLWVRDTGVGIAPGFRPSLFDPFKQESEGVAREYEGAGLGLTLTKQMVELLGGAVRVESTKGEGSTFTVDIPSGSTAEDRSALRGAEGASPPSASS
jgi:two-component system cell cycle sensor histidine kinase PleC